MGRDGARPLRPGGDSGGLEGTVYDAASAVALPGATVSVTWPGGRSEVLAGGGGRFALCELPPATPLRVQAAALGFKSGLAEFRLARGEDRVLNLVVPIGGGEPGPSGGPDLTVHESVGGRGRIVGRVLEAETGAPLEGVFLGLEGGAWEVLSGPEGTFSLDRIPAGEVALRVRHLGYGARTTAVEVPPDATVEVELRLAAEPIEVEPLTVTITGVRDRARGLGLLRAEGVGGGSFPPPSFSRCRRSRRSVGRLPSG